ncbi:MAG: response regulator [Ferribacterium limneticum]
MAVTKVFCTTREAAALLGVSLSTAQNWAESGLLESWKTEGGHRRISRESVQKLIADPIVNGMHKPLDQAAVSGLQVLQILVVEDDPLLLKLYKARLGAWKFPTVVETASDGFEGLVKVGLQRPDLLITDLQMPHMDGFQMINSLAQIADCSAMQIVAVTGLSIQDIASSALPSTVRVFTKPIPFNELESIAELLASQKKAIAN